MVDETGLMSKQRSPYRSWRREEANEEVERVEVGEGAQRLEERNDVGLREGKRLVDVERGEIDPLRGRG